MALCPNLPNARSPIFIANAIKSIVGGPPTKTGLPKGGVLTKKVKGVIKDIFGFFPILKGAGIPTILQDKAGKN